MKRALVLSGGGSKGAFQLGALQYIYHQVQPQVPGYDFNLIAGVSVGALNGVMLAQNEFATLEKIWLNITDAQVYTGKLAAWSALRRLWSGEKSILGNEPLLALLRQHVSVQKVQKDFRFGAVSLVNGHYIPMQAQQFTRDEEFCRAILASTSMPIIWPPVPQLNDGPVGALDRQLIDGGVRNISPLSDVLDDDPDEIVIINCNPKNLPVDPQAGDNLFRIALRALTDITINEIFRTDVVEFLHINDIIGALPPGVKIPKKHRPGKFYKQYRVTVIEPEEDLGNNLDFSPERIRLRMQAGYQQAQAAFGDLTRLRQTDPAPAADQPWWGRWLPWRGRG
ncbi:MAG: patatin-like phospholipase family protein [Bernardetiaceae bacterium]|nr:patatin-like phospholipase family protein [Bernardetiaceae bacterium]